jgi:hypothetical protein
MRIDSDSAAAARAGTPSRFSGTLLDILDQVSYARVDPAVIDDPIYRLRYRAYTREGFMDHNPEEVCIDNLDHTDNNMSFGIYIDGDLVSSIRLHHLTPSQRYSPSLNVFPDVLGPMLDAGMTFIDPSRFTADREASLAYPALPFLTLRIAAMASVHFEANQCLALVRPEHGPFYKRVFGSERLADERSYPGLHFPVGLFGATVDSIRGRVAERFPFFLSTEQERHQLFSQLVTQTANKRVNASARQAYNAALAVLELTSDAS